MNNHQKIIAGALLLGVAFIGYWIMLNNRSQTSLQSSAVNSSSQVSNKSLVNPIELEQEIKKLQLEQAEFNNKKEFLSPSLLENASIGLE